MMQLKVMQTHQSKNQKVKPKQKSKSSEILEEENVEVDLSKIDISLVGKLNSIVLTSIQYPKIEQIWKSEIFQEDFENLKIEFEKMETNLEELQSALEKILQSGDAKNYWVYFIGNNYLFKTLIVYLYSELKKNKFVSFQAANCYLSILRFAGHSAEKYCHPIVFRTIVLLIQMWTKTKKEESDKEISKKKKIGGEFF